MMSPTASPSPFEAAHVVAFDIDGTLIDSVDAHANAWQRALASFDIRPTYADIRAQIGKGSDQLLPVFLTPEQIASLDRAISQAHDEIFRADYKGSLRAFPGVRELFEALRADGKTLVLASSGTRADVDYFAHVAHIDDLVDLAVTSDDTERSKPKPDILQVALTRLAPVSADATLMVGDSPWDAQSATRCGMPAIGLTCGGFARDDLERAGCRAIYRDVAELLQIHRAALIDVHAPASHWTRRAGV